MPSLDSRNDEAAGAADRSAGSIGGGGIAAIIAFVVLVTYLVSYDAPTSNTAKVATPKPVAAAQAQRAAPRTAPKDGIAQPRAFPPIKITPAKLEGDAAPAAMASPAAAPPALADEVLEPQGFGPIKVTLAEPEDDIATATIASPAAAPPALADEILEPQAFGPIKITQAEPDDDLTTASIVKRAAAPPKGAAASIVKRAAAPSKGGVKPAIHAGPVARHTAKPHPGMTHHAAPARHGSPCSRPFCDLPSAKSARLRGSRP
ncbi:hypothetical protein GGD83_002136 [Rhodoblastus sphagnicola]|nr:hypothetical protein [Rhodoblastus sphagnicola]MBB4198336.1 hypothetical protein [Rhodoblastus sphagnicola]